MAEATPSEASNYEGGTPRSLRGLTRRLLGWAILTGCVVLPLLPGLGLLLSSLVGLGLF